MTKRLLAGLVATVALVAVAAPASACPAGYVPGWNQGHKICHVKPAGNVQLKPKSVQKQQGEKRNLRAAQRDYEQ